MLDIASQIPFKTSSGLKSLQMTMSFQPGKPISFAYLFDLF